MHALSECPCCGAYYLPSAAVMLEVSAGGNCAICGTRLAPARRSPDPSDPWERPMSRRECREAMMSL
jgi:hypothetical protein